MPEDGLSFDIWIEHQPGESLLSDVAVTFLNWLHTNQQGMLFGLGLAVLVMSLLPLIRDDLDRWITRRFSASLAGALFGAPLGVCVNCAAPIGYGMYRQGARLESAAAMMIASPTLNVVVISMAISLFPFYVVAVKIAASLLVVLLLVPMIAQRVSQERLSIEPLESAFGGLSASDNGPNLERGLQPALLWLANNLARNAWYLVLKVVPIMLLAGVLGSIAVVLIPWESLGASLPASPGLAGFLVLLLIACFGLLLPVPIAFDVVLAATLASSGVPMVYVATLLFVLGTFSVYSYLVLLRAGVARFANWLALAIALTGVAAGTLTGFLHDRDTKLVQAPLFDQLQRGSRPPTVGERLPNPYKFGVITGKPVEFTEAQRAQLLSTKQSALIAPSIQTHSETPSSAPTLNMMPFGPGVSSLDLYENTPGANRFVRVPPRQVGLRAYLKPLELIVIEPFPDANAIASGDINNDGWFDLVLATAQGTVTYLNEGGYFRLHQQLRGAAKPRSTQGAMALIDLDNDGFEDLLFGELDTGLWFSRNNGGEFELPRQIPGTAMKGRVPKALAFADLTGDGALEIVVGNTSGMVSRRVSVEAAQNLLIEGARGSEYRVTGLPGVIGETLSIYIGDVDGDGVQDLIEGNDFDEPDLFSSIGPDLAVQPWHDERVESTTHWTMSIESVDVNNDLIPEIYLGNVTQSGTTRPFRIPQTRGLIEEHCLNFDGDYCRTAVATANARRAVAKQDASACGALGHEFELACIAAVYHKRLDTAVHSDTDIDSIRERAGLLRGAFPVLYDHLMRMTESDLLSPPEAKRRLARHIHQETEINNLLFLQGDRLVNRSRDYRLDITGWTWNARFADLDNDGWQDLYVVNGQSPLELEVTNVLLRNRVGREFSDVTKPAGLRDFEPTLSYTYIDYDNDGDLDIISFSQLGRVAVWRNELSQGHSLQVDLRDSVGNRMGLGARITAHLGDGSHQMRDLTKAGGHMSFDATVAHFGLGKEAAVERFEVLWSDGTKTTYQGPFSHGHRYRLQRGSALLGASATGE
ncbi:MAG: FG-GAP-like repeat-containing protein [Pseudomonadota bacterium]